jgi:hypothetical protein
MLVGVGTLAAVVVSCKGKSEESASSGAEPALTVQLADLVGDYKANEVRADGKYKGKRVQVTGVVDDIKKNAFDQIYVVLGKGAQFDLETAQCHFPKEDTAKASALDKGTTLTVDCKCEGKILTSVNLADCKFVGTPPSGGGSAVASKDAPPSAAATGPTAAEVCQKLTTAGVAKNCAKSDAGETFDIVGMPKGSGTVVALADDHKFAKYLVGVEASPQTAPIRPFFPSAKAHVVVHLMKGVPAAVEAKTKAVVDAL